MKKILLFSLFIVFILGCTEAKTRGGNTESHSEDTITDTAAVVATGVTVKPVVNFYIENSGSMDGFVKGVTEFEQAIYSYLSDIKIAKVTDSLNLFYINSDVFHFKSQSKSIVDEADVLRDFIEKLEPSSFKARGGKRGESDISDVIKQILANTEKNSISILVTDGIFSPGSSKDAEQYLINQQIGIKNSFSDILNKEKNTAVIVYQLSSQFDGTFYDKVNRPSYYKGQLPFYIYIIGNVEHLNLLRNNVPESKFKGSGVQHIFSIISGNNDIRYAIHPSIGKFKKSKTNTSTTIENLTKDKRSGQVRFAVNVDFSSLLLDDNYLLNIDNYENNSEYTLEIKPSTSKDYTHTLFFSSERVHKGPINVKLKAERSEWVDEANDNEGVAPLTGKTFGIKYQIDGIFDAFTFDNKYYTEIIIQIK